MNIMRMFNEYMKSVCEFDDREEEESVMKAHVKKIRNLFLRQSYLDSWEDYQRSLNKARFIKWDYIILTASNEMQACAFRVQIQKRLQRRQLPVSTHYAVLFDPDGKRVGSGGATFNVLRYIAEQEGMTDTAFKNKRILVIHSGGDSKRVPSIRQLGSYFLLYLMNCRMEERLRCLMNL